MGDLLVVTAGDKVVADGVLAVPGLDRGGLLAVDESSLTGESEAVKKSLEDDPWVRWEWRGFVCVGPAFRWPGLGLAGWLGMWLAAGDSPNGLLARNLAASMSPPGRSSPPPMGVLPD